MTGSSPEQALNFARDCRDWGNKILIFALLAEILLEFWEDNRFGWYLWTPNERSFKWRIKKRLLWLRRHCVPSKHWAVIIAVTVVALGVIIEWVAGDIADTKSDQIRAFQQARIAEAETVIAAAARALSPRPIARALSSALNRKTVILKNTLTPHA
jgi:hypothetical protein